MKMKQAVFFALAVVLSVGIAGGLHMSNATDICSSSYCQGMGKYTAACAGCPTPLGLCSDPTKTTLLYPFITNQAGFDTGVTISNTAKDPFGTAGQTGTCTLNFYAGATATLPSPITTPTIAPGDTYTFLASTSVPGFQGYMIAVCNFGFAAGFAFISDLGARNLAMGYLPTPICNPRTNP